MVHNRSWVSRFACERIEVGREGGGGGGRNERENVEQEVWIEGREVAVGVQRG